MHSLLFTTGWNDTEYGINNWVSHPKWNGPLEWADHLLTIIDNHSPTNDYHEGVRAAVLHYREHGTIDRLQ